MCTCVGDDAASLAWDLVVSGLINEVSAVERESEGGRNVL